MMFGMVFGWILILAVAVWALTTLFPSNRDTRRGQDKAGGRRS